MATSQISYQIYMLLGMMTRRLDDHNFITWRYQFQTLLEGLDLFGYVDGNTLCPTKYVITDDEGVTNEITTSYKEWKKTDKAILSLLIATLSFDIMDYVVGSKTSREAWMRLNDRYASNSRTHVMQLKTDLYSITKGMDSVEKYLLKVIRARNQLVALGERMEEEDIVVVILNGLPAGFNLIKAIIRARETPIAMSELRILLLAAERDIARNNIHSTIHAFSAARTQIGMSQGYMVDNESHIGNTTLNGGCNLDYFEPPCSISALTTLLTAGTQSSGVSTCAHDFSSTGDSFDTLVGASPTVVHGGEHIMINGVKADFNVVDNFVSTDSDEGLFVESQNELEKVVDDVKSFDSEDDQFCDSHQQLDKNEADFTDVVMLVKEKSDGNTLLGVIPELSYLFAVKEIRELGNIKKGAYLCTCVMQKQKLVMKLESVIVDKKKVCHFSLMDEMKKLILKLSKVGWLFNPQDVDISFPVMFQGEGKFDLILKDECAILISKVFAECHGYGQLLEVDLSSISIRRALARFLTHVVENSKLLKMNGHFIYVEGIDQVVDMFESFPHLIGSLDKSDIRKDDYRRRMSTCEGNHAKDLIHRAGLNTSRVCSSSCLSHVQAVKNEGDILCHHISYRCIVALTVLSDMVLSNTWFFSRLANAFKRTFCATVFYSIQNIILCLISRVLFYQSQLVLPR